MSEPLDEIIAGKFTCTCGEIYKSRGLTAPDCFLCNEADTIKEIVAEQISNLTEALRSLCKEYKQGADSGDWGNWAAEDVDAYNKAMAAIKDYPV